VIRTAPQLGRHCLTHAPGYPGRRTACSHAGSGSGAKARVVARYLGGCGAGRTYACIQPNGDVTPCVYMPRPVMGNVRRGLYSRIWRDHPLWEVLNDRHARTGHCASCKFMHYCGGCRARADAYFGRPDAADPGCVFNQREWDRLVAAGTGGSSRRDAETQSRQKQMQG
jgi:radical SAM protein with 4Fe4S-binding SPASM domain